MAKSSEKALVKPFCEKNFTEFLARVEKGSSTVCARNMQKILKNQKTELLLLSNA